MLKFIRPAIAVSAIGLSLAAAPAFAATEKFSADLTAAAVGASDTSTATGTAAISFDTKTRILTWSIAYTGLTGKATAAHFHGPAAAGASAPPEVPLKGSLKSPVKGHAKLTAKQVTDLEAGMLYLNVHTAKYPDGEIRGQVEKAM